MRMQANRRELSAHLVSRRRKAHPAEAGTTISGDIPVFHHSGDQCIPQITVLLVGVITSAIYSGGVRIPGIMVRVELAWIMVKATLLGAVAELWVAAILSLFVLHCQTTDNWGAEKFVIIFT
jgi:hypothetical protein